MNQRYIQKTNWAWQNALRENAVKKHLMFSFTAFIVSFEVQFYFLNEFQYRQGVLLHDQVLNFFTPRDFSLLIFLLVYGAMLTTILIVLQYPKKFVAALYGYALLTIMRTISIYFVPLEPPVGMIFLNDPIARFLMFKEHAVTKDLFFSGHIASLFFFLFVLENKHHRQILFVITLLIGVLLIIQRVHYSTDIFAAPFFAYACYRVAQKLMERI